MDDSNHKPNNLSVLPVDSEVEAAIYERDIEAMYVGSGMSSRDIADKTNLPIEYVKSVIKTNKLSDLRQVYLHRGISKIQNKQLGQAKKLLDLEYDFKRMRLRQLETILQEFKAYYEKHGDFRKRHPVTGEILRNNNGIALQMDLPTVTKEINGLKESVTLSQGLKTLLYQLDSIINKPKPKERVDDIGMDDVIDMAHYDAVFRKKE